MAAKEHRSFMKPEWRRKIYGEGGPAEPPPKTPEEAIRRRAETKRESLPRWLRAFEIWRPTAEEEARRSAERARPPGSLTEHVVPKSELEYIERMRRQGGAAWESSYRREMPGYTQAPPRERSRYGYAPPPPAARPGFREGRHEPPRGAPHEERMVDPISVFNLPLMWEGIRKVKQDARFRGTYGVGKLSREGRSQAERAMDVLSFFKVPENVIRRVPPDQVWSEVVLPLLSAVTQALNAAKPSDLPGRLKFDFSENGAFGLVYVE